MARWSQVLTGSAAFGFASIGAEAAPAAAEEVVDVREADGEAGEAEGEGARKGGARRRPRPEARALHQQPRAARGGRSWRPRRRCLPAHCPSFLPTDRSSPHPPNSRFISSRSSSPIRSDASTSICRE